MLKNLIYLEPTDIWCNLCAPNMWLCGIEEIANTWRLTVRALQKCHIFALCVGFSGVRPAAMTDECRFSRKRKWGESEGNQVNICATVCAETGEKRERGGKVNDGVWQRGGGWSKCLKQVRKREINTFYEFLTVQFKTQGFSALMFS